MSLYDSRIQSKDYDQLIGDNLAKLKSKALETKEPTVKRFLVTDVGGWLPIITPIIEIPTIRLPKPTRMGPQGKYINRSQDRSYRASLKTANVETIRRARNHRKGNR